MEGKKGGKTSKCIHYNLREVEIKTRVNVYIKISMVGRSCDKS